MSFPDHDIKTCYGISTGRLEACQTCEYIPYCKAAQETPIQEDFIHFKNDDLVSSEEIACLSSPTEEKFCIHDKELIRCVMEAIHTASKGKPITFAVIVSRLCGLTESQIGAELNISKQMVSYVISPLKRTFPELYKCLVFASRVSPEKKPPTAFPSVKMLEFRRRMKWLSDPRNKNKSEGKDAEKCKD